MAPEAWTGRDINKMSGDWRQVHYLRCTYSDNINVAEWHPAAAGAEVFSAHVTSVKEWLGNCLGKED